MRIVLSAVAVVGVLVTPAAAEPMDMRPNVPLPYADEDTGPVHHQCVIGPGGVVRIDGKLAAWREDRCGPLPLKRIPASCQENREAKVWRLFFADDYWIYLRINTRSTAIRQLCPQGMEMENAGAAESRPAWRQLAAREDDKLITPRR